MNDFELDTEQARKADSTGRISENGGYKGEILAAWKEISKQGTQGFAVKFKTDEGQTNVFTLWVKNAKGEKLSADKIVHKIMTCTSLRALPSKPGVVGIYNFQQKKDINEDKEIYPDLAGKRIGFLLERENELYTSDGTDKESYKMQIFAPFRYEDHKMAAEILDKSPKAQQYEKVLNWIVNKKPRINDRRTKSGDLDAYADGSGVYGGRHGGSPDLGNEDDIPF
jgi:hypothetical protein